MSRDKIGLWMEFVAHDKYNSPQVGLFSVEVKPGDTPRDLANRTRRMILSYEDEVADALAKINACPTEPPWKTK